MLLLLSASYSILTSFNCRFNIINNFMKKKKVLYEDVVVGGEPPEQNSPPKNPRTEREEESDIPSGSSEQEEETQKSDAEQEEEDEKEGKDEKPQSAMEQRAEKMTEDPFMTQAEVKNMDGGSKEKEQKAEKDNKKSKDNDKERQSEIKESKKDLDIIASRANQILFSAKAIFPFDFFPNSITIDANKVNIIIRTFFFTETVTSILLKEIMDVRAEITLFLGKLVIDYGPHPLKINTVYVPTLWKSDALRAKEIIEGVLVAYRAENIDTTKLKPEETLEKLTEVGKMEEERP